MRVLVCGGRNFDDWDLLSKRLNIYYLYGPIDVLIHGGASGADCMAGMWAKSHEIPVEEYLADWSKHGNAAGPVRNREMLEKGKPDVVLAFPGGKGTRNMVEQATKAGIKVIEVS